MGRNFVWYLGVSEVNANIAPGHFQNVGNVGPILEFRRHLEKEMIDNNIGI